MSLRALRLEEPVNVGARSGDPAITFNDGPPKMTQVAKDTKPIEYVEAKIPFYQPKPSAGIAQAR